MIIDTHVHIGGKPIFEMEESVVLSAMAKQNVDKAIVSNADSVEMDSKQQKIPDELQKSMYDSTVRAINFARNNPGKIFVAAWIKLQEKQSDPNFEALIERNLDVVKALKFHPYYSAEPFNSERTQKFIELAEKFSLPVIAHTAADEFSKADFVAEMAQQYPNVKFIMAHLELDSDNLHAIDLCKEISNLYADTAWVNIETASKFIEKCGSEKILFGSDMPIDGEDTYLKNKEGTTSIYKDYFDWFEQNPENEDALNLMCRNAQRIFNI